MKENGTGKLGTATLLMYGLGTFGEGLAYNLFYAFFIYFITTAVGLSAATAGTISLFAVVWDAVTDPLIGSLSDRREPKKGRRVPFMLTFSVPLGIVVALLFFKPDIPEGALVVYYAAANILFWLFFTCCDIPYLSLGSEITEDYNERTKLRVYAQIFMALGGALATSGALLLVGRFVEFAGSEIRAWGYAGILYGAVAGGAFLVSGLFLKHREPREAEPLERGRGLRQAVKGCLSVLRLKQYRKLIVISFLGNAVMGIGQSTTIYVQTFLYGLDAGQIAIVNLVGVFCNMAGALVIGGIGARLEKKTFMAISMAEFILGFGILFVLPHTFAAMLLSQMLVYMGYGFFWTIIYSMNYDMVEVDDFCGGTRREGLIVSLNSFLMKLGISVGMWLTGVTLSAFGFDAVLAGEKGAVLTGLYAASVALPILAAALALAPVLTYKVTGKRFAALQDALKLRGEGKEFTAEGFEELL